MKEFTPTKRSQVRRVRKRGSYDRETVYQILDEGKVFDFLSALEVRRFP
ncbi:MAG: hypothetical protein QNJ54_22120 [Prochloraceae cyanobacterium]|nr:hypothetical protein [Prochloraceae cyanobacterium]